MATGADVSAAGSAGRICLSLAKSFSSFSRASLVSLVGRRSDRGDATKRDDERIALDRGVTNVDDEKATVRLVVTTNVV